jgi:DNA-binding response OmpR family regulator
MRRKWRPREEVPVSEEVRAKVLVADDDEDVLSLVALRLERTGYEVITARDGEEALRRAREASPALAVLDVMMPRMTGYDVTRALREDDSTRDIPVILLTARVQEADVARGLEAGADDYIEKPFSPQELRAKIEAALSRPGA